MLPELKSEAKVKKNSEIRFASGSILTVLSFKYVINHADACFLQIVYSTQFCVIPSVLSGSLQLRFLGSPHKSITIYTNFLVEYINYLKIFLKKECFVM